MPEDLPWCDWLYFTLHGYPVPAALAVYATKHGFPLPDSISAFPDPNDPTHLAHRTEALSDARFLIVVVSPCSAHARQIDEDIRAFKRAGGEERIIALVVEGAPQSSSSLCVRSSNREWLPRWLEWRLGPDGQFNPADPTEPLVIDARPGFADLDDVMTSLMAVLLDVPREELELLEALTRNQEGAVEEPTSVSLQVQVAAPEPWGDREARDIGKISERKSRHVGRIVLGAAAVVGLGLIAAGAISVGKGRKSHSAVVVADHLESAPVNELTIEHPADPPLEKIDVSSESLEVVASPILPSASDAADIVPSAPTEGGGNEPDTLLVDGVEEKGNDNAATNNPPAPAAPNPQLERELAARIEKEALVARAEALMSKGDLQEAAEVYDLAIEAAQRFASLPGAGSSAHLEVVRLCRTLGVLQTQVASSAEAQRTFERGRKVLQKLKLPKEYAKERRSLMNDLDAGLRRLKQESF